MRRRTAPPPQRGFANLGLLFIGLIVGWVFAELVIFRFFVEPGDVPANDFANGIFKYEANQTGTWRIRNKIAANFSINANGWNSGHQVYRTEPQPGKLRIAVIGDSYVEAFTVPSDRSLAEQLEDLIGSERCEVFRFAIAGAPLSQYVHMFEREVVRYRPAIAVIVLVHNDFVDSFTTQPGRYTSSFLKLHIEDGAVVDEIAPAPYASSWFDWVRRTATMRYLYYRWQVNLPSVKRGMLTYLGNGGGERGRATTNSETPNNQFEANIVLKDVDENLGDIVVATDYLLARLKNIAADHGVKLVLVMDAPRNKIYHGLRKDEVNGAYRLNRIVADAADRLSIAFVDLYDTFEDDWRNYGKPFEGRADAHWNTHAHGVVANAVFEHLRPIQPLE